ncbi:unnamed protein product [Ceratitis capitata]|uniref:(Mediterranean fruit fly) hypothetical protein n=1 Tax=Ceratitis capitata TaxID=7213 RepID=A0A811UL13_CERCA|nr:unnamed protein product [Ceratitis capitata]
MRTINKPMLLGVTFDSRRSFTPQNSRATKKTSKRLPAAPEQKINERCWQHTRQFDGRFRSYKPTRTPDHQQQPDGLQTGIKRYSPIIHQYVHPKTTHVNLFSLWSAPVESARFLNLPLDDLDDLD